MQGQGTNGFFCLLAAEPSFTLLQEYALLVGEVQE